MEKFNEYFVDVLTYKYADFEGRANKTEYWYFILFGVVISIFLSIFDHMIGSYMISTFFSFALFIPNLAIGVRRLRDIGKSGWWMLLSIVPLLGVIALVYLFIQPTKEENYE